MIFVILTYSALIMYVYFGISVYRTEPTARVNKLFIIMCLLFAVYPLAELIKLNLGDGLFKLFLTQLAYLGWLNYVSLCLLMILYLIFGEQLISKKQVSLIIFPGIACSIYNLFSGFLPNSLSYNDIFKGFEVIYIYLYTFIIFGLIFRWYKNTSVPREKKFIRILFVYGTIAFILITIPRELVYFSVPNLINSNSK